MNIFSLFQKPKDSSKLAVFKSNMYSLSIPYDYGAYYDMYKKHQDLRSAIGMIARNAGSKGYQFIDEDGDVVSITDYGYLDFIRASNQKGRKLFEEIVKDLIITGNVYLFKIRNEKGELIQLQRIHPKKVFPRVNEYGDAEEFIIKHNGIETARIPATEMVRHVYDSDPDDEVKGLSIVESIIIFAMLDQEAAKTNLAFFKNSATPSGIIQVNDDNLSDEQREVLAERLQRSYSGSENKFKNMVVSGAEVDIKQFQQQVTDAMFSVLMKISTQKICSAIGVPAFLLGYTEDVNLANGREQYKIFYDNVSYWEGVLETIFNRVISEEFKVDLQFEVVVDHTFMREWLIDYIIKALSNGLLTINEGRRELGYPWFENLPDADQPLVSKNLSRLEDIGLAGITPQTNAQ